jgi:flagellar biosynthesis/type III secretory pathway ATPase
MKALAEQIGELDGVEVYGRVVGVRGLMIEVAGPIHTMSIGARVVIETGNGRNIPCEVVGFSGANALLMPFAALEGVRRGCRAVVTSVAAAVRPSPAWLGRVVNAMGEPIDGKGALPPGPSPYPSATRRRPRMRGRASARRSISGCARSTPSSPAAAASAWASSPAPASANRCCCRCWRATFPPMFR